MQEEDASPEASPGKHPVSCRECAHNLIPGFESHKHWSMTQHRALGVFIWGQVGEADGQCGLYHLRKHSLHTAHPHPYMLDIVLFLLV
jgi:hypothetical protein